MEAEIGEVIEKRGRGRRVERKFIKMQTLCICVYLSLFRVYMWVERKVLTQSMDEHLSPITCISCHFLFASQRKHTYTHLSFSCTLWKWHKTSWEWAIKLKSVFILLHSAFVTLHKKEIMSHKEMCVANSTSLIPVLHFSNLKSVYFCVR